MSIAMEVSRMNQQPGCCTLCGGSPSDDEGNVLPAVTVPGLDVNWGDSVYICWECARVVGELRGLVTVDVHAKLVDKYTKLKSEHDELVEDYNEMKGRMDRMLDGARARKEAKASAR